MHPAPQAPDPPIRVVLFTSGPALEAGLCDLLSRLESEPGLELTAVYWETSGTGLGAVVRDLWRRRRWLAPVLAALEAGRRARAWLSGPRRARARARAVRALEGRIRKVPDVHAPSVLDELAALEAGLGLSYGSPILRPALFDLPRHGTLGIHHGKLPEYRGKKTPFWAMYHGEPHAWVTIQRINAKLDGGEIVQEGGVPIGRRTPGAVWRELEALGVALYLRAILDVREGAARFEPPRGAKGPLYRDPTPRDLLVFWVRWLRRLPRRSTRGDAGA